MTARDPSRTFLDDVEYLHSKETKALVSQRVRVQRSIDELTSYREAIDEVLNSRAPANSPGCRGCGKPITDGEWCPDCHWGKPL